MIKEVIKKKSIKKLQKLQNGKFNTTASKIR